MTIRASANRYNFYVTFFVALGSFTYGYHSAMTASVIGLPEFFKYFEIDTTTSKGNSLLGAINGVFYAGGAIGCWTLGWLADAVGRRRCIQIVCLVCIIASGLMAGSVNVAMFLVGRLLSGFGVGMITTVVPTYQSELAPPSQRGRLVGTHGTFIVAAYSVASWTSYGCYYSPNPTLQLRLPLSLLAVPPLALFCGSFWLPESPRWLISQNRDAEGVAILENLHRTKSDPQAEGAHLEALQIRKQLELEKKEHAGSLLQVLKQPNLRKRMFCGFFLQWLTQSTGILVIFNYQIILYQNLGLSGSTPLLLLSIYNLCAAILNWVNSLMLDRFRRIHIFAVGLIGCSVVLSCYTAMVAEYAGTGNKTGSAFGVFFLFLIMLPYAGCLDASSYVYTAEIFPQAIRAHGVGFSISGLFLSNLVYQQVAPTAFEHIKWKYFLIFIIMPLIGTVVLIKFYPETKGLSLEEIAGKFGDVVALDIADRTDADLHDIEKEGMANKTQDGNSDRAEEIENSLMTGKLK